MNSPNPAHLLARLRSFSWLLAGVWTACIAGSLLWNLRQQEDHSLQMARQTAAITFENDVLYRRWSAQQGGVYVRVSAQVPPNPYLQVPDRDVTTTSGVALTLVNPAYMARMVNDLADATAGSRGHLTSLKPLRPENAPDAWEAAALRAFERGITEVHSIEPMADGEYLRLMRPFLTEQGCLKCHADQGYREGDIRGGISVSVPMASFHAIEAPMTAGLAQAHAGLWLVGLAGVGLFRRSLGRELLAREWAAVQLRASEAALEAVARKYSTMFNSTSDGVWLHNLQGEILEVNDAYCRLSGYDRDELVHQPVSMLEANDAPDAVAAYLRKLLDQGGHDRFEARHRRKDSSLFDVDITALHLDIEGGRIAIFVRDITERKRTEAALRRLSQFPEENPNPVLRVAGDGTLVYANAPARAWLATLGWQAGESLPDAVRAVAANAHAQGRVIEDEIRNPAGAAFWFSAVQPAGEHYVNLYGRDVTARKQTEAALRDSQSRLELALEAAEQGTWEIDLASERVTVSPRVAALFGMEAAHRLETRADWRQFVVEEDRPLIQAAIEAAVQGTGRYQVEFRVQPPGMALRWVRSEGQAHYAAGGAPPRLIGVLRDITERKATEAAMAASLREKEVLLKEIHHRVKNNLQVISSLVSLQADGLTNPALRDLFQDVRDRVRSMALVHEKLYQSENLAQVDFAEYARSLLTYLWRTHGQVAARIGLKLDLQAVMLSIDIAVPCGLLLNELVTNALKHAFPDRAGGEVTVALRAAPAGRVRLTVRDNGVGLPAGLDWQRSSSLGLRLVQMLTTQVLGATQARPVDGGGTEFEITFNP